MTPVAPTLDPAVVSAFRAGTLTSEQVEAARPRGRAAVILLLLQPSTTLAAPAGTPAGGAHQPSGGTPPYAKPAAATRREKRGAGPGHPGVARPRPEQIDPREPHQLPAGPDCGGERTRTGRTRTRCVEDIPDDRTPEVTEHTIHRDWCPCCKTQVEPKRPDAPPDGTLGMSDFRAAYDAAGRTKQTCWPHLLRDLEEVDAGSGDGGDRPEFARRPRRVYTGAARLELARGVRPPEEYDLKSSRLHGRIVDPSIGDRGNAHATRLGKRRHRYGEGLRTSVEFEGVPPSNNHAGREVRPAGRMRKARYGNQSEAGASTRAVPMTVCRARKKRGLDPMRTILDAPRSYATTGVLPPLPEKTTSKG